MSEEQRGRPVVALFVGLGALASVAIGLVIFYRLWSPGYAYGDGFLLFLAVIDLLGTLAVLASGARAAWQVAQGRPGGAAGVVFITLVVTAVLAFGALFLLGIWAWGCIGTDGSCGPGWAEAVLSFAPAVLCLVWGLVKAWRVATGRSSTNRAPAAGAPADPGLTWRVSEPGVDLMDSLGGSEMVARLPAGTEVAEVERLGDFVRVTTWDGRSGWVERHTLFHARG